MSVSQSVGRMVAVFELFERERRPLTSSEMVERLEAPRSSMAALLAAMVALGILSLDRRSTTYLPTARFARLGAWLTDSLVQDPRLPAILKSIQQATAETVTLAAATDQAMEVQAVERGNQAISFIAEAGQRIPFWTSAIGAAYLSTLPAGSVASLYERSRRQGGPMAPLLPLADLQAQLALVRRDGYATAFGTVFADAGAIAVPLPTQVSIRRCVVTVAGPAERLRARETQISALLLAEAARLAA